jgi:hypothetical protein
VPALWTTGERFASVQFFVSTLRFQSSTEHFMGGPSVVLRVHPGGTHPASCLAPVVLVRFPSVEPEASRISRLEAELSRTSGFNLRREWVWNRIPL